ncbi:diguanylate cyclase [Herbaspirillum autotrophicum]|uniref:diguanylate cyclase n=1 Tax=Herbaspirillum autotrophicum TaxID=180195 RepID=UPI000AB98D87|nr:diguanylate cyclase [Herbaspirillum autotrophicum]
MLPQSPPLVLQDQQSTMDLWPSLRMLSDPRHAMSIQQVLAESDHFTVPSVPYANLGPRPDTVWLRAELQVPADARAVWWLNVNFLRLDELTVYLVHQGRVMQQNFMSQQLAFNDRPWPFLPYVVKLPLEPGERYEVVIRARKYVKLAMLMPVSLQQTDHLLQEEAGTQFWQSLLFGLGLCMVAYALLAAILQRERLYIWFALFAGSSTMLWFCYFGLAAQHFWPDSADLSVKIALLCILLTPLSGFLFVERALALRENSPRISFVLRFLAALLAVLAFLFLLGALDGSDVVLAIGLIGPWPLILVFPQALRRAREGDPIAIWVIAGMLPHGVGLLVAMGLHHGVLPRFHWIEHLPQVTAALDLLAWVMAMSLRSDGIRRAAAQSQLERDRLLIVSQTDALTGLLNRRGLEHELQKLFKHVSPSQMLALYVIDLDGFKPINDAYGHDAGDEALTLVAQRLRHAVRGGDLVGRLGGDEFVVVAPRQHNEVQAAQVAEKLLACCIDPFILSTTVCEFGMTIGYAIAPIDAASAEGLLKYADTAMYEGKRAGKRQIRRIRSGTGLTLVS